MLILKDLEHSLWCHLCFITETHNCRASCKSILTLLKCKFVSKLLGLPSWKEFWQCPCPSSLQITNQKIISLSISWYVIYLLFTHLILSSLFLSSSFAFSIAFTWLSVGLYAHYFLCCLSVSIGTTTKDPYLLHTLPPLFITGCDTLSRDWPTSDHWGATFYLRFIPMNHVIKKCISYLYQYRYLAAVMRSVKQKLMNRNWTQKVQKHLFKWTVHRLSVLKDQPLKVCYIVLILHTIMEL
jgi:hypothetical protein